MNKKANKSADELEPRIDVDHHKPHSGSNESNQRNLHQYDDPTFYQQFQVV